MTKTIDWFDLLKKWQPEKNEKKAREPSSEVLDGDMHETGTMYI